MSNENLTGEHVFCAGGLANWPDATAQELLQTAEDTLQDIESGLYENPGAAMEYVDQLLKKAIQNDEMVGRG